jgi:hypothetical protein
MHRLHSPNRLRMEQLETRQMMAADTGMAVVSTPAFMEPTVTVGPTLAGDFNGDGKVNGRDFLHWQRNFGSNNNGSDANLDGIVDGTDLEVWQQNVNPTVGGIKATILNGSLFLEEAEGQEGLANGLTIARMPNGKIRISGSDPNNSGVKTLINGQEFVEFEAVENMYIYMGDGDNDLRFHHSMGSAQLQSVYVAGGSGADRVQVDGLKTSGDLSIGLLGGDDVVMIAPEDYGQVAIGDLNSWDALRIDTGAGSDVVFVGGGARVYGIIDIKTFEDPSETDFDEVTFDFNVYAVRDVNVSTGGGSDVVQFTNALQPHQLCAGLHTLGNLTVDTGAGNDLVYVRGVKTGGNLEINTGAGADDVTVDFGLLPDIFNGQDFLPRVQGNLTLQMYENVTDADFESIRIINRATVDGSITAKFGAGNDYFLLDNAEIIGNDLDLHMGDGDDLAEVSGYVVDHLMAWMEEGNDTLNLGKTWAYRLIADGDLGSDSLTTTSQTKAQYKDFFEWENINGIPTSVFDHVFEQEGMYWMP